jgi:hypothetical protein
MPIEELTVLAIIALPLAVFMLPLAPAAFIILLRKCLFNLFLRKVFASSSKRVPASSSFPPKHRSTSSRTGVGPKIGVFIASGSFGVVVVVVETDVYFVGRTMEEWCVG